MVSEVGLGWGNLIFNVESLLSNQQFCVKSRAREVKDQQSNCLLVSHCELDDKVVGSSPGNTQILRGLLAGAAKHLQQATRIRSSGVSVSGVEGCGVTFHCFCGGLPGSLFCWDLNFWIVSLLAGLMWKWCIHILILSTLTAIGIVSIMV